MSSLDVRAGLALINKWAAMPAEIQISLSLDEVLRATLEGTIIGWRNNRLSISGSKSEVFVDLSFVEDARNVVTGEGLEGCGLPVETYSESVTFSLAEGEVTLTALPQLRATSITN